MLAFTCFNKNRHKVEKLVFIASSICANKIGYVAKLASETERITLSLKLLTYSLINHLVGWRGYVFNVVMHNISIYNPYLVC